MDKEMQRDMVKRGLANARDSLDKEGTKRVVY